VLGGVPPGAPPPGRHLGGAMTNTPKAIPTRYGGCLFRSRLEARWAIYFDHLKLRWMHEREAFDLGPLGRYLPDFWFSDLNCWGEVKPSQFTRLEFEKAKALPNPCILFDDQPAVRPWFTAQADMSEQGFLCEFETYTSKDRADWCNFDCDLAWTANEKRLYWCFGEPITIKLSFEVASEAGVQAALSHRFDGTNLHVVQERG
jgi:hypothetical protein